MTSRSNCKVFGWAILSLRFFRNGSKEDFIKFDTLIRQILPYCDWIGVLIDSTLSISHGIEMSNRALSHRLETVNRLFLAENGNSVDRFLILYLYADFQCFYQKWAILIRQQRIRSDRHSYDVMFGHESYFLEIEKRGNEKLKGKLSYGSIRLWPRQAGFFKNPCPKFWNFSFWKL